jgi:DNA-binding FrmR family transcriptional regulator
MGIATKQKEHADQEGHEGHGHHAGHMAQISDAKKDALKRLAYIDGHLAGVRRMIESDKYCVDVLKQTFAIRRALQKLEGVMLEGHLHTCVIDGVRDGREDQVLGELMELYSLSDR